MSHCSTIFSQFLKLVPRHDFETLALAHQGARTMRVMSRWKQFVAMAAGQLTARHSLRDVVEMLTAQAPRLYHLGSGPVARTSLARVNEEQPYGLYEALFARLAARCQGLAPGHRFRFKSKLFSFDASLIELSMSLFPWHYFAKGKAAVKLHVGLDHDGFLPMFATLSEPHASEADFVQCCDLPKGSIVVFDKGVIRFSLFSDLDAKGVFFVTRAKSHNRMRVVTARAPAPGGGIVADEIVEMMGQAAKRARLARLRCVTYRDGETGKEYVFVTNNMRLAATTIARIYKERWRIELFFKWIKQNLRVKTFMGESLNAVLTQLWIALCVYLLLAYLKFSNKAATSLSSMLRLLQVNLFMRRDLTTLLLGKATDPPPNWQRNQMVML